MVVDDLVLCHAAGLQALEVLHQVANREVRGIALTVVAVFLAQLKRRDVGHGQNLAAVSAAFKHRLDHALVFPGQATEQNGHLAALFRGEGPLGGATKVVDGATIEPHHAGQACAFLGQLPLNLLFGVRERQFIYGEIDASHVYSNLPLSEEWILGCVPPLPLVPCILWCLRRGTHGKHEDCRDGRSG